MVLLHHGKNCGPLKLVDYNMLLQVENPRVGAEANIENEKNMIVVNLMFIPLLVKTFKVPFVLIKRHVLRSVSRKWNL